MNYYKANTHEILPKSRNRTLPITSDNHYGVITHLEPDILQCEVKWVLGSITTNKVSEGKWNPSLSISNPKR